MAEVDHVAQITGRDRSTESPPPPRRAILALLGAVPVATPVGTRASPSIPTETEIFVRWQALEQALAHREQAQTVRDRIERDLIATPGYPRIRLPNRAPTYAADPATINRTFGPGHQQLRRRLKTRLARRQLAWDQAAEAAGLRQAIAREDAAFIAVQHATTDLLAAPARDMADVKLKLAVIVAGGEPGPAESTNFPWAPLRSLLADLERIEQASNLTVQMAPPSLAQALDLRASNPRC